MSIHPTSDNSPENNPAEKSNEEIEEELMADYEQWHPLPFINLSWGEVRPEESQRPPAESLLPATSPSFDVKSRFPESSCSTCLLLAVLTSLLAGLLLLRTTGGQWHRDIYRDWALPFLN